MTADGEYLKQLSDLHLKKDIDPDWLNPRLLPVLPNANRATIWGRLKLGVVNSDDITDGGN